MLYDIIILMLMLIGIGWCIAFLRMASQTDNGQVTRVEIHHHHHYHNAPPSLPQRIPAIEPERLAQTHYPIAARWPNK